MSRCSKHLLMTVFRRVNLFLVSCSSAELTYASILIANFNTLNYIYKLLKKTATFPLDQENDSYIKNMILRHNQIISKKSASRPYISVFIFREPGDDFSKKVLWDKTYIVDSSNQLFNLLFKKRIMCGNSIIVLPDRRFVFVSSDPHFDALSFTKEQISSFLRDK